MNSYVQQLANHPLMGGYVIYKDGSSESAMDTYRRAVIDPNLKYPKTTEFTVGADRQIVKDLAVSADFVYRKYRDQLFRRFINLIDPETGLREDPTIPTFLMYYSNYGQCDYKGLSLTLQKRYSHGYQFLASFTYQVSEGNSSLFTDFSQLQKVFVGNYLKKGDTQMADMWGKTIYDKPYAFKVFGSATLPLKIMISGVFNLTAGTPYSEFNRKTRKIVSEYQALRSPDTMNIDLRLEKQFKIRGVQMKLQAEAFNLTNRVNVYEVVADVTSTSYNMAYRLGEARRIQFGVRFEW